MSYGFKTPLDIRVIGSQTYEVLAPLVYERKNGQTIQVNPGFDFDGASIPRAFWSIVGSPMTDGYQEAACLHDALYASEYFSRKECDELFLEAMESKNVFEFKRNSMYEAVRTAGWMVWKEHKREEVIDYRRFITIV